MFSFPLLQTSRRRHGSSDDRLGRLGKVLDRLDIEFPRDNPESVLGSVPPQPMPRRSGPVRIQPLELPIPFEGRVAVLEGAFQVESSKKGPQIREFSASDFPAWTKFGPGILVAPLDAALWLADQKLRGLADVKTLETAIIVTTRIDDTPLAEHHRELLWCAFEVPVFEQLKSWDGTVVARECEVHDGLHVVDREAVFHLYEDELLVTQLATMSIPVVRTRTGWTAELLADHCECGKETPRLRNLAHAKPKVMAAAAGGRY